ncbi:MAG: inositol monophosphatase family protein [Shimia sp.]
MFDAALRQPLIDAVRRAARAEILPRFRRLGAAQITAKSSATDLVTEADLAMEAALRREIAVLIPDARIVGEEGVAADPRELDALAGDTLCIVLDPIDGTWNFARGLSTFGVLLAVVQGGETLFGLLYDAVNDDWVWAAQGEGTWYRDQRLHCHDPGGLDASCGIVSSLQEDDAVWMRLAALFPRFQRVSDFHASVWDYRSLVAGHYQFTLNAGLNPWDHAAGVLAVREAGGHAALLDGTPYRPTLTLGPRLLTAASERLWEELCPLLSAAIDGR